MHDGDDLDIPESNREIALHLKAIRLDQTGIRGECSHLNSRLDALETTIEQRRYKFQDVLLGSLLLPLVGGILLFLLTKALG
jgi:hypothetical protein